MPMLMDPHEGLRAFACTISNQPMGLVVYAPETWADVSCCFQNATRKAMCDGGAVRFGWTFLHRIAPGAGGYLVATHHAVWHAPDGTLVDVTPFHEDKRHHPITQQGSVLFLVDDAAQPVETGSQVAPLPLRYFPLGNDLRLLERLGEYREAEERSCRQIYARSYSGHH